MLRFPRLRSAKDTEEPEETTPAPPDPTTILLCEDEPAVRDLFAMSLREVGYHVLEASDGLDALDVMAAADRIDLVVADVVMPIMEGPELADLRERHPDMRFIFISGDLVNEHLGPNAQMLQTPSKKNDLLQRIIEVIGPARLPHAYENRSSTPSLVMPA
jgi:CheY-like chemotaxis protein